MLVLLCRLNRIGAANPNPIHQMDLDHSVIDLIGSRIYKHVTPDLQASEVCLNLAVRLRCVLWSRAVRYVGI
jgi:hypothetical protein